VRDRDIRACEAERAERADRGRGILDIERDVQPVEPTRREGRVLHPRRQRVLDRVAEKRHVFGHPQP
jgi:hypothetical protein